MKRCKAKVTSGFIGGLVQCKRHIKHGKYCYQHRWLANQPNTEEVEEE